MKKFKLNFNGRLLGAIGIYQEFNCEIMADTEKEAILKAYDKYQDINHLRINGQRYFVDGTPVD